VVDRLKMALHQEAIHSRRDCLEKRQPENSLPEQRPIEEIVEHCRRSFQGKSTTSDGLRLFANETQENDVSYTYGCLDPVMVTQMAKYLDTVYVSGWQASSTASSTDEPGPDLADYPYVSSTSDVFALQT
jgi:isocitrate lyase